ncbi:MAG: hypothetical protein GPOALKHO_001890 [Sodalis sp.]|nr:MAG: hypothetical protein GPOALKHO_001890 [Sodalis sp.]
MEDINVVDKINHASNWLVNNQELLIHYAVNIVAPLSSCLSVSWSRGLSPTP